jgi:hypothetical protein
MTSLENAALRFAALVSVVQAFLPRIEYKQGEGINVSYTMADYRRDVAKEHFKDLTPEEQHQGLQGLPPEVRLAGLSSEERLAGLSSVEVSHLIKKLQSDQHSRKNKPRRKT